MPGIQADAAAKFDNIINNKKPTAEKVGKLENWL